MGDLGQQHQRFDEHHLAFFGKAPVLYHCHHFNLFLDQTIDDALGAEAGAQLRTEAGHEAAHALLSGLIEGVGAHTAIERLNVAQQVFSAMGHGRIELAAPSGQGEASGRFLHYGFSWFEKYGKDVRRRRPADGFAAGYIAAAAEVAYDLPYGSVRAHEDKCVALRDDACHFVLEVGDARERPALVDLAATKEALTPSRTGLHEDRIEGIAQGLIQFLGGVAADDRGLVQGFGVFITLHLAGYYNRISYGALEHVREHSPGLTSVFEALLRESGQVCVFHTIGGIVLSPEWEGLVGVPSNDVEEHVISYCAIVRALGFGRWCIGELEPDRRLVLQTPVTYETPFPARRGVSLASPSSYFLQGAAAGFMELAHRVPWRDSPQLSDAFYRSLFSKGQTWTVEQTKDAARGDELCEVVARRID